MFNSTILSTHKLLIGQKPIEVYRLPKQQGITIQVTNSIVDIGATWSLVAPTNNLFLQQDYLQTLEQFAPDGMDFRYVIVYQDTTPIGVAYFQIFQLSVEDSLKTEESNEPQKAHQAIGNAVKKWIIKQADFKLLISGNMLLTGEHGMYLDSLLPKGQQAQILEATLLQLQALLDKQQKKVSIHFIKDHLQGATDNPADVDFEKSLTQKSYHSFLMQPGMRMNIRPHWTDFDQYLEDMSSKYRVRARRARKKGAAIQSKVLSLEEIEANETAIYQLYQEIAEGAGFNAFLLHPQYFTALKRQLGDRYQLVAYYIEGELVAFYTAIFNYGEMDAHFLGVNGAYNREHQVYLNILYDLVKLGIDNQCHRIDFARTALEIKSSIGAEPTDFVCFIKHRNTISTKLINLVFDSINPKEVWQPRSPFRS